jgi:hypothetical protein
VVVIVSVELVTVTPVLACAAELATLLAVTVIDFVLILAGAVNKPLLEMLPALADQITPVLLVLVTAAVNCSLPLAATEGFAGET